MRKRKLLIITAALAAGMCICWGATAFADPPNTTAMQQPDAGKTIVPAPPDTMTGAGESITVEASEDTLGMKPLGTPSLATVAIPNESTWEGPRGQAYSTGFEAPFTIGFLGTQQGWAAFNSTTQPRIATGTPYAGTQQLRLAKDAAVASGTAIGGETPVFSPKYLVGETYTFSVQTKITATGGADYYVEPFDSVSGLVTTRVRFGYESTRPIYVMDYVGGLVWVLKGNWTANTWKELKIVQNLSALGNIKYYYGGTLLFDDTNGIQGVATQLDGIAFYDDNYNTTDLGNFDAFSIANLAGSGACCAAGGTGVCSIVADQAACTAVGGTWKGSGTTCTPNPCLGACCANNDVCTAPVSPATCTAGGGTYKGDGTTCGPPNPCPPLVYDNTGATSYYGNAYTWQMLGDDVLLDPLQPTMRALRRYVVEMYGTAVGYNLTCQLYTRSGNLPGTPIAGTSATWTGVAAGWRVLTTPEFGGTIALPDSLFVVYTISGATVSCGPLIGQHAELPVPPPEGTEDFFVVWDGSAWLSTGFGGTPPPWAGFQAKVYCAPLPDDGACCLPDPPTFTCVEHRTAAQCATLGGTFYIGQLCTPNICKGACCKPVDGSCTEVANQAACTALSGSWRGVGTVCPPAPGGEVCYTRPTCQPGTGTVTLFGQQPFLPDEDGSFYTSDAAPGYLRAEKFENTSGTIKDVHWWGLTLAYPWAVCDTEDPTMTFNITFYNDNGAGLPLYPALKTYAVTPTITSTGLAYGSWTMKYFSATLPPADPWYQVNGWVGIQGTSVGTPTDCWFLWASSPFGNAKSALDDGTGWAEDTIDLAVCITGTSATVYGACCEDETTCIPNRSQMSCQPPWRWEANKTCAQMSPQCGKGACCSGPLNAKICTPNVTQDYCQTTLLGVFQGLGSLCTPDPCNSACCKPNHAGCVLTDEEYCITAPPGGLGGVFKAGVKTCTPDPCPPAGDTCEDPIVIPGPGSYAGDTCLFTHDYDSGVVGTTCPYDSPGAKDVVYSYTPTADICVDMTLCTGTTDYDTKLYIYTGTCANPPLVCNDDMCANPPTYTTPYISRLTGVNLTGGTTYFIVVDGYGTADCGLYTLLIATCCDVVCTVPPGVAEGEPTCADEYVDATNGGCTTTPNLFSTVLTCNGPTVCGTSGTYLFAGGNRRDTDWYEVVIATPQIMTLTVEAEFDVIFGLIGQTVLGVPGCANTTGYVDPYLIKGPCEPDSVVTACLPAGTYYIFVAPSVFTGVACGKEYKATLTCAPCTVLPGACCNPIDGTCTLVADAAACPTGSIFHGAGTVCDPNPCYTRPTCPANTLWGQQPYLPDESWNFGTSDTGPSPALNRAEYYTGVAADICDLHWWGLTMYNDGTAWSNCTENPMTFQITFYADAAGVPGAVVWTGQVVATGATTGLMYGTFGPMLYYSAVINPCAVLPAGWVSIQGISLPANCWFVWAGSPQGNGASALWTGPTGPWAANTLDLAVCLTGATVLLDFGDAPDSVPLPGYPTLSANNGARHVIVSGVYLGLLIDAEGDGQPNADATGDDLAGIDDEDGVTFVTPLRRGQMATIQVVASVAGFLDAWLDFNADGVWAEPGERIFNIPVVAGVNTLSFQVPPTAALGLTFARFRFNAVAGGLLPTYLASNGEVEDYRVLIEDPTGACCQLDGTCAVTTQAACTAPAIWRGAGTTCTPNLCPTYCATCRADVNGDGIRNGKDVQFFVNGIIALAPGGVVTQQYACADINMDGYVNMTDVPLFVTALISTTGPCP